jgi:hypothetical protein
LAPLSYFCGLKHKNHKRAMVLGKSVDSTKRGQDTTEKTKSSQVSRIIRLPISEAAYKLLMSDRKLYIMRLSHYVDKYPNLFPKDWYSSTYGVHDLRISKKLGVSHYIVRSSKDRSVLYDIQPNFVMPYMSAYSKDVSFGLLLILFGVPFWLVAYGLGKNAMYWYRLFTHLGRFNLLATTIQDRSKLPQDICIDEKISYWSNQEIFACMTVGSDCILGMGVSQKEDEVSLRQAYGVFKEQALALSPDYEPLSINLDGWTATKKAMQKLYGKAVLVLCFLHSVIKIRQVAQKEPQKKVLFEKVWLVYKATDASAFDNAVLDLVQWTSENVVKDSVKERVFKIGKRKEEFKTAFQVPTAMRTTNMVDRLMKPLDRFLFMKQYFHGHFHQTQLMLNAFALCLNFSPFCPRTKDKYVKENLIFFQSRADALNGCALDQDWLKNLLSAASCNEIRFSTK